MLAEKLKERKEGLGYEFHSPHAYSEEQSMHLTFDLRWSSKKLSAAKNSLKLFCYDIS